MAHRGMRKLRQIEKAGLIVLCVAMLATLGVSSQATCGSQRGVDTIGTFTVAGETVEVSQSDYQAAITYLTFQNYVLPGPPPWKFARFFGLDRRFQNYQASDKDLWTFIMLDRHAEQVGVRVPPETVSEWIRNNFRNREGVYDRAIYEAFLRNARTWNTPAEFEKLLARYLRVAWFVNLYNPLVEPTMDEVYATWKRHNRRHDVRYVVQEAAPLRAEIDASAFTEDELQGYYDQDRVKQNFRIPTRRGFEAVYAMPGEMTEEEYEALEKRAEEEGLVTMGPDEAFQYYYANQRDYPIEPIRKRLKEEWEKEQEKKQRKKKAEEPGEEKTEEEPEKETEEPPEDPEEESGEDRETDQQPAAEEEKEKETPAEEPKAEPEETPAEEPKEEPEETPAEEETPGKEGDEPSEEPRPEIEKFEDPTLSLTPKEKYDRYFKEQVERELLVNKLLGRLLDEERIDRKGLAPLAEKWGLTHFVTEELLDQYQVAEIETIGSHDLRRALNRFLPDKQGEYVLDIVRVGSEEKRGWLFFKVLTVEAERYPALADELPIEMLRDLVRSIVSLDELEGIEDLSAKELIEKAFPETEVADKETYILLDVIRPMFHQAKAEDAAEKRLETIREMVVGGSQTLESACREKGLEVRDLKRVSKATPASPLPEPDEGRELTPEEEAERRVARFRNFLVAGREPGNMRNVERIAGTEAERFVAEVIHDKETDAAYLVYVVSHHVPGPEEMPTLESRRLQMQIADGTRRETLRGFFEFEQVAERYGLDVPGLTSKVEETEEGGQ